MDTGGQTLFGVVTANHLGEENTQIADDQILELNVPKNDMDQFSEETLENGVMALSKITETPIPTSKCATGTLRMPKKGTINMYLLLSRRPVLVNIHFLPSKLSWS